jgi:hypothetical protein
VVRNEEDGASGGDILNSAHFEAEVVASEQPEQVQQEAHELRVPLRRIVGRRVALVPRQRGPRELFD